jgi:hypothetical protein
VSTAFADTGQPVDALQRRVAQTIDDLVDLMDASDGWAYDTYDTRVGPVYVALCSRRDRALFRYLLFALYAIELAAPITYRRLRRIPKTWDPMGNSYRAGVELTMYRIQGDPRRMQRAAALLARIATHAVGEPGRRGFALGFPCITGSNRLWSTQVPVAHYTLRVARKFLYWEQISGDTSFRSVLTECIAFLHEGLPWIERDGCVGVGYTPADPLHVVNIWADVASLLAAYDRHVGDPRSRERSLALVESVIRHQNADGSFPYYAQWEGKPGEEDNTHTAMVLGALADVALCYPTVQPRVRAILETGVPRWLEMFFDERTGRHWNLVERPRDVFTVCLGDALYASNRLLRPELGLSRSCAERLRALEPKLIEWSLNHLRLRSGHFCERRLRFRTFRLGSIRSFDGLVCDALALYLARKTLGDEAKLWMQ